MKKDTSVKWEPKDPSELDLSNVRAAIFGGTGGLGRAISRQLAERGADVLVVGRTFRDQDMEKIKFLKADLSLVTEADRVANEIPAKYFTHFVFTTGIIAAPKREETAEGLERDMAISYLSRYVLMNQLAPHLGESLPKDGPKPKVFIMGFPGSGQTGNPEDMNSEASYGAISTHMNTVAANEALVLDATKRYPNIATFGLNPGLIKTDIRNNYLGEGSILSRTVEWIIGWTHQSPADYAKKICSLLVSPDIEGHSGAMFDCYGNAILQSPGLTPEVVDNFMKNSKALVVRALAKKPDETASKVPV
ncbi:hypothetical protein NCAS_0F02450 [Naumovozyma castellii]|uniref:Ketoreductase (KR) domain-containing protein n=1 Tax=Naumovozyma castellii TaxID=27288 RepID=G0VGV8_NAUCA|nr:hypothetical protein NCAS_0F02450 [Naumovozyma castellii CBS 4309]CCC70729.1 hypothetical protein NCAS_0F02450 [Naumovozyma castellii CBS 4309]